MITVVHSLPPRLVLQVSLLQLLVIPIVHLSVASLLSDSSLPRASLLFLYPFLQRLCLFVANFPPCVIHFLLSSQSVIFWIVMHDFIVPFHSCQVLPLILLIPVLITFIHATILRPSPPPSSFDASLNFCISFLSVQCETLRNDDE